MISAEQWGINAPAFVKSELNFWIDYIQDDASGSSGYTTPEDYGSYSTVARSGALLVRCPVTGDTAATPRVQQATSSINTNWGVTGGYGNKENLYAMYAVFKGLTLLQINTLPGPGDWHDDYDNWLLVPNKTVADGINGQLLGPQI